MNRILIFVPSIFSKRKLIALIIIEFLYAENKSISLKFIIFNILGN